MSPSDTPDRSGTFVPALGFRRLTPLYDTVVRLTNREDAFKERLVEQAAVEAGMKVLDLGCGTGTLAIRLKGAVPGAEVVGLDGDPEMLARAEAKARRAATEIHFDEGMSFELPYPDASFDRVLSSLFFHHLTGPDRRRTLAEVERVLRPGGELHVADWGRPGDPLMRLLSLSIATLDGREQTADNLAGRLPAIVADAGLEPLRTGSTFRTIYGTLALFGAVKPAG